MNLKNLYSKKKALFTYIASIEDEAIIDKLLFIVKSSDLNIDVNHLGRNDLEYNDLDYKQIEVPDWNINKIDTRLEGPKKNPNQALDFNDATNDIEEDL